MLVMLCTPLLESGFQFAKAVLSKINARIRRFQRLSSKSAQNSIYIYKQINLCKSYIVLLVSNLDQ